MGCICCLDENQCDNVGEILTQTQPIQHENRKLNDVSQKRIPTLSTLSKTIILRNNIQDECKATTNPLLTKESEYDDDFKFFRSQLERKQTMSQLSKYINVFTDDPLITRTTIKCTSLKNIKQIKKYSKMICDLSDPNLIKDNNSQIN